jgi:hypothetical protein
MTQQEIEVPPAPEWPGLPEPPAYWPSTVSKYSRHKVQRRDHCHIDVRLLHDHPELKMAPRVAMWRRKGLPTDKDSLLLCDQHRREYLNRDNAVRVKAHLAPLAGGG